MVDGQHTKAARTPRQAALALVIRLLILSVAIASVTFLETQNADRRARFRSSRPSLGSAV
jgi:hypothetical protein